VQIIRNGSLRTTPAGDQRVEAYRLVSKTKTQIDDLLADYADKVRALAKAAD
jgi:hypothetical protein